MNKNEIMKWLKDHYDAPEYTVMNLWIILRTLIEFLERESKQRIREQIMEDVKGLIKGVLSFETP